VSLDDNIVPKRDASAQIAAIGFVGDVVIDLNPGQAAEPLPKSQVIVGGMAAGLTDRAEQLSHRADSVLMGLQTIVNLRTADELLQTLVALQGTLKASQRMMDLFANQRQGPTAELTKTMQAFQKLSARFDSVLANPALARLLNSSDTLMRDLSAMSKHFAATGAQLDTTLQAFNRGQGTLGKLATDTALYNNLRDVTKSFNELLDDIKKHPGKLSPSIKACIVPFAC
jgi:phospholipid/cholesterol/gamma-HCH transport system substrate-binding protein